MPILHLPGEMMPGTVGADQRACALPRSAAATRTMSSVGMPSVMQTTSGKPASMRLENGVGGVRRRHENDRGIRVGLARRFGDGVEHRHVVVQRAALAGRDAGDDLGAVSDHLLRVEACPRGR